MIIEQTFSVRAPLQETAAFFLDIERVSRCMPGVENVEEVDPGGYQAVLAVRLGPIRAAFQGTMTLDDAEAPGRLRASAQGRDKATGSVAKVEFTADLREEEQGETTVVAVTDMTLRGRMSQFGTGVIRAAAGELVDEFASCVNASLAASGSSAVDQPPTSAPAPASVSATPSGMLRILRRSAWKALKQAVRRVLSRRGRSETPAGSSR